MPRVAARVTPGRVGLILLVSAASGGCARDRPSPPPANTPQASDLDARSNEESEPLLGDAACRAAAAGARPAVRWTAAGFAADMNYDGATDLIVWGTEGDSLFVVSVVECVQSKPGRIWSLPLRALPAFGTLDLEVSLTNPAFGRGYLQENCMGAETTSECRYLATLNTRLEAAFEHGGHGLQIGVPDRHNIHVYWDSDSSRFVMWGL